MLQRITATPITNSKQNTQIMSSQKHKKKDYCIGTAQCATSAE